MILVHGQVKLVEVAYYFCLNLPATFWQPHTNLSVSHQKGGNRFSTGLRQAHRHLLIFTFQVQPGHQLREPEGAPRGLRALPHRPQLPGKVL